MKRTFDEKAIIEKPAEFAGARADAPLVILLPKAAGAILLSDVLILSVFWLSFGELPMFAFGFVIFLTALQILVIVGLRFGGRKDLHSTERLRNDALDKIGAWWLMACAFGALFGWISAQLAVSFPQYENGFLLAAIVFSIFLPVAAMLPNLRYLEARISHIQIPLLFFVTVLPVLSGIGSLLKLWQRLN
ncbi:MAG TPA: hypothetical protein VIL74_06405 [Pyrinomonadaceae bacterium]|jgi:hypothetical protein